MKKDLDKEKEAGEGESGAGMRPETAGDAVAEGKPDTAEEQEGGAESLSPIKAFTETDGVERAPTCRCAKSSEATY